VSRIPLAIVGNGGAAAEAVLALRAHGYTGRIHLFADNEHAPYNPMLGTYLVSGRIPAGRVFPFGDRTFYEANRVTAHLGKAVTALDATRQVLATADGASYQYERCLVASGSRPSVPSVPGLREALAPGRPRFGDGLQGPKTHARRRVFTLRSLDDALSLKEAVDELRSRPGSPARAAVLGASFAGVKVATVLHDLGMRVSLIESESHILPTCAHVDCARLMEAHLLADGYELRLGAVLAAVEIAGAAATGRNARSGMVRLHFGALPSEDIDLMVVCTGTRPALEFLLPGQVDVDEGILVDEQMRSNIPTLYAAGDAAQGKNLVSGRREIIGLWSSARYQGRTAGRCLAGMASGHPGAVPHNITHVGRMLFATVGRMDKYDRLTVRRERDSLQVRAWRDERLVGVNLLNCCRSAGVIKQAMMRAATGAATDTEATWTSFNE